jgi:hypothetical protein
VKWKVLLLLGDFKKNEAFYIIMYILCTAVILEETTGICRNIWIGANIFVTKFHEDILYDIETTCVKKHA